MNRNARAHASRPMTMKGIERRRILRRPMVSIKANATRVNTKFVRAMESEAPMGDVKPTSANMVAEKYMSEF